MIALIILSILCYLAVGIVVAFVGPAARSIDDAYREAAAESRPKAQALRAILVTVMAVLWPVMLPSAIKTRRLEAEQRSNSLVGLFDAMVADGVDADVIPDATGEFGLTATNPIPTRTPLGSESYLRRLRTSNGETISWSRLGSTIVDGIQKPIDMYEIRNPSGDQLATLYVSAYHKRNSRLAPRGFRFEGQPDQTLAAPSVEPERAVSVTEPEELTEKAKDVAARDEALPSPAPTEQEHAPESTVDAEAIHSAIVVSEDKLELRLHALGVRVGRRCRAAAEDELERTESNDPWDRQSLDQYAEAWAARRGYMSLYSDAGMRGLVDGADPLFVERRSVFVKGVRKGLVDDDDDDVANSVRFRR